MKAYAVAQLELPRRVVDRLPGAGQSRHWPLERILIDQRLEDVHGDLDVRCEVVEMRIDRRHRGAKAECDFLRCRGRRCENRHHDRHPSSQFEGHCGAPIVARVAR